MRRQEGLVVMRRPISIEKSSCLRAEDSHQGLEKSINNNERSNKKDLT